MTVALLMWRRPTLTVATREPLSWGVSGVPVPLNSSPQTHGNPGHFSGIPVYPAGHLGPRNDQNGEHQTVLHYNVKCTQ